MENIDLINIAYEGLAFFMLLMAIMITIAPTVLQMIPLYQFQSFSLALVTMLTASHFTTLSTIVVVFLFTTIPIMLMLLIEPLLVLASVPEDVSIWVRIKHLFDRKILQNARQHSYPLWMAQRPSTQTMLVSILLDLLLMLLGFIIAFTLVKNNRVIANVLAISFSLLMLGLSIMRSKQDIISQIMGLLVMEHGMFLAAIRLISNPIVIAFFVVSLFLYIIITLTILVFLLPDLHRISNTIDIDQQKHLKG